MDALHELAGGQSSVTLQKYLDRLSRYWKWLDKRHHVGSNPWQGLTYEHQQSPWNERERPFTDEEMRTLLGKANHDKIPERVRQAMADLMPIAALTGCRLDPIICLSVGNCANGTFLFKPQKREGKPRLVPIHSSLREIIIRCTEGRKPEEPLFPEWPAPRANSMRERSFKASNAFTEYRRSVGVDERVEGKRRSLVNFHSFRRWFITKAEQADQPPHIIQVVVGHKRQGMTLGVYSAGPDLEQARRCIEAVKLPVSISEAASRPKRQDGRRERSR